jgi:hypothetical protein
MKYYRCYLLTADDHIVRAKILKCADDEDAKRQCREVAVHDRYPAAEVWDGARWICRYPEVPGARAGDRRRRKGDASDQDVAIADALSMQIAEDRRSRVQTDMADAARLREQRLATKATTQGPDMATQGHPLHRRT